MKTYRALPVLLGVLAVGGCDNLVVPDFNNPSIEDITGNPSRAAVVTAAQGLFVRVRAGIASRAGWVSNLGIIGRESFNFDAADPRFVTELLRDQLDGGNLAFGGNFWTTPYRGFREADIVLNAVNALESGVMSDAEKSGIRGLAKTFQALLLLQVIVAHDDNGAVVSVAEDPTGDPEPIVDKATVYSTIESLLDAADGDLAGAGASFPGDLAFPSGFSGFDTPDTFREFNRALRARVDVYQGDYAGALTALQNSFVDAAAPFSRGVYYSYGTGSGDAVNSIFDPSNLIILANVAIRAAAQLQTDGVTPDQRFVDKLISVPTVTDQATLGLSSDLAFNLYNSAASPVPIVRNEELIILRAEANIGIGGAGNLTAANDDLNLIRGAAGLAPIDLSTMTPTERIDALLYERRFSLLFEGGHRWIDMRRYGRLADLAADDQVAGLPVHGVFPFPVLECDARVPPPSPGC